MNATNFINNSFAPLPNQSIDIISPASNKVIGKVALSSPDQVDAAVQAAHNAFLSWSSLTVKSRIQYLIRFHQLVIKYKGECLITKEEALAEVAKGNETVEFALSLPQIYLGTHLEVSRGVHCQDVRRPHGVVVSIVPFNFPFMGNTFVLKPSEKVPLTMGFTMKLIQEAGFPEGVVNIVHGTASVVQQLCDHPKVKAVTFVGTSHVAELLSHRCRLLNKRVLCLGGAKNHLVASPDCDIDMASSDIVASFSGCSGQRCMAASVLLTIGSQPKLLEAIVKKAEALGPAQSGKNIGPVIDAISRDKIVRYIEESEKGGAKILLDGRKWITRDDLKASGGFWVGPTVILHTNKKDSALHDEIFGPVISIYECSSKEEAIEIENANPYGNAGAVAEWYTKRFSAGMLGVNIGVPVPREPFSFGGINRSNFGDFDITGLGGLEFFTHHRKITTKWTPPKEASWMKVTDTQSGETHTIPIVEDTASSTEFTKLGITIYDNGYLNTAVCRSSISYIDGDKGILRYRGYDIEELAEKSSFLEVSYLLIFGDLPTKQQFQDIYDSESMVIKQIFRCLGKLPTIAACAYRHRIGRSYNYPSDQLGYTENFLYMLDRLSEINYVPHPKLAHALDVIFILHADHELNCSTAAMRQMASTGIDPFICLSGAASALYGPSHGGANEAALKMLEEIGSVENIPAFLEDVKAKKRRLMGFGHRIYKSYDPRAKILKKISHEVFEVMGRSDLIDVAMELERIALNDGWLAHWKEQLKDQTPIFRPKQVYIGKSKRAYVPMHQRKSTEDPAMPTRSRKDLSTH
ncbi:hypothetical protein HDV02_003802 [Globomyces sp. JEL0801]|nr:hypothetical protein HDV02_003802 [Globomyces sp. JEL0801]